MRRAAVVIVVSMVLSEPEDDPEDAALFTVVSPRPGTCPAGDPAPS